jgi:hypothetical protein
METIILECPRTNKSIVTGVHADQTSLSAIRGMRIGVRCPHCSQEHELRLGQALLACAA